MSADWCNRKPMRKTIVRNVEVKKPKIVENGAKNFVDPSARLPIKVPENKKIDQDYHQPHKNTLIDMRRKLDNLEEYAEAEENFLQKTKEKIAQMQGFSNKQISNQLNFPPTIPIYKNLPPLYDPEKSLRADKLIKHTKMKVSSTTNAQSSSKEINELLRQLVDLEYQEKELTSTESMESTKLHGEDEFLGLDKFNKLNLYLLSDKEDNERFIDATIKKTNDEIFRYESFSNFVPFHKQPTLPKNPGCGCLQKIQQQKQHSHQD